MKKIKNGAQTPCLRVYFSTARSVRARSTVASTKLVGRKNACTYPWLPAGSLDFNFAFDIESGFDGYRCQETCKNGFP